MQYMLMKKYYLGKLRFVLMGISDCLDKYDLM